MGAGSLRADPPRRYLFAALLEASELRLLALETTGVLHGVPDPMARNAFLLANDLVLLVRREQVARVLGVDPLSRTGMARWTETGTAGDGAGGFATASGPA